MTEIKLVLHAARLHAYTPYEPAFVRRARALGGKWDANRKTWHFDPRDEETVRTLMRKTFGTDGLPLIDAELCRLRVTMTTSSHAGRESWRLGGRTVAIAYSRDSGAKVGEAIAFLKGRPTSSGSVKNWTTLIPKGAVFEVRDFPRAGVEAAIKEMDGLGTVEVLDNAAPVDVAALTREREALTKRLAEIDAMLASQGER